MEEIRKKIKLVASDIGSTLAGSDGELSAATRDCLLKLMDAGVLVALVTGYNKEITKRHIRELESRVFGIVQNGALITKGEEVVETNYLSAEHVREAVALYLELGFTPIVFTGIEDGSRVYYQRNSEDFEGRDSFIEREDLSDLVTREQVEISAWEATGKILAAKELVEERFAERCYVATSVGSERSWLEVLNPRARKEIALKALMDREGISADEALYFGDNLNDVGCFELVKYPVAVGNGLDEVKRLAWRVAPGNDDDGVAAVLSEIFGV